MINYTGIVVTSETRGDRDSGISAFLFAFDDTTKACRTSDYYTATGNVSRTMTRAWARNRSVSINVEDGKIFSADLI